jgi:hypothetical protein
VSYKGQNDSGQGAIKYAVLYPGVGIEHEIRTPEFSLLPPRPNPCNLAEPVAISFRIASPQVVSLSLFDVAGRRVAERLAEPFAAGSNAVRWDPGPVGAGVYILQLRTSSGRTAAARLIILR